MKKIIFIACLAILGIFLYLSLDFFQVAKTGTQEAADKTAPFGASQPADQDFSLTKKPGLQEVTESIPRFFSKQTYSNCINPVVSKLTDVKVGEYSAKDQGWPVYAQMKIICASGGSVSSQSGDTIIAYAKRTTSGAVVLFLPEWMQAANQAVKDAASDYWSKHPINIQVKQ